MVNKSKIACIMSSQTRSGGPPPAPFEETYICTNCHTVRTIMSTQTVVCEHCHGRIFRKLRTPNIVQFVAR